MSYAALAEEDRYAPAGLGCDRDCRCSAGRGLSGLAQTPPAPTHVREVRVVVKSFIRCIGGSVGSLPLWCPLGSSLRLRAMAFATDRMMCEEPMHDRKDKRYRLFSACTFQVTCQNGNVTAVTPSALDTDTGKEGPLQAPPLIASPVRVVRTADGFEFSWFARGRPHLAAEPPFQLVCPRTSVYIWHRVSGRVRCTPEGTDVSVNLSGSKFPTHRVFVNGTPVRTVPQGGFARLWFPVSLTEPTRVEGFSADATPRRFGGGTGLAEGDFVVGQAPAPAPPAGPVFRFECPAGCPQGAEAACRRVLYRALVDAIGLCLNAASQLEATPRSIRTRNIFRSLFGHDPSRPVPWADNKESGAIVAHRLRKVAEAFHGRVTHFRCGGFPGAPAGQQCAVGTNAFTIPGLHPNVIFLCPPFWNQEPLVPATPPFPATAAGRARVARFWRAGIVLHEMLHLLYRGFFRHATVPPHPDDPQERRRDNAHCYEAFTLQVAGHSPDPSDITQCRDRPA